ncbi:MAG: hypothetical protein JW840_11180 [Candidatus Thermoplasmatota archaeon]|nr:hypothetical protein [Candidatus Thermoplasmatota archaeon]
MDKESIGRKLLIFSIMVFIIIGSSIPMVICRSLKKNITDDKFAIHNSKNDNDTTPPVTTISFDPPNPDGYNGWYVSNVTVTLNATDNESGVYKIYCSLLPPGEAYTEPILLSQDGIYVISFWSVDFAGNAETPKSAMIRIDKTPPIIVLEYTWESVGFRKYVIIYTATCTDALSGMNRTEFYKNGELQETIRGPGPEYTWTDPYVPFNCSFRELIVKGLMCNPSITDEYVTFYAILVLNLGSGEIYPYISAYAYDNAGNWDYQDISQPSPQKMISPGTCIYLSFLEKIILPNNYDGYIGSFFINAKFYNDSSFVGQSEVIS